MFISVLGLSLPGYHSFGINRRCSPGNQPKRNSSTNSIIHAPLAVHENTLKSFLLTHKLFSSMTNFTNSYHHRPLDFLLLAFHVLNLRSVSYCIFYRLLSARWRSKLSWNGPKLMKTWMKKTYSSKVAFSRHSEWINPSLALAFGQFASLPPSSMMHLGQIISGQRIIIILINY